MYPTEHQEKCECRFCEAKALLVFNIERYRAAIDNQIFMGETYRDSITRRAIISIYSHLYGVKFLKLFYQVIVDQPENDSLIGGMLSREITRAYSILSSEEAPTSDFEKLRLETEKEGARKLAPVLGTLSIFFEDLMSKNDRNNLEKLLGRNIFLTTK